MTSKDAKDTRSRQVRDGLTSAWPESDLETISTDEALVRLSEARNVASKSASQFMLISAVLAFLYILRLQSFGLEIAIGPYSLANLPFGLFVLSSSSLVSSCISLIRIGDSRSYDRQLILACEIHYKCNANVSYLAFPNEHAWGEPFSKIAGMVSGGFVFRGLRIVSLTFLNLFLLGLVVSPAAAGLDFVFNNRLTYELSYRALQWYMVAFLTAANISTFMLVFWIRFIDRD